jgi:PAS domain S-box-containing protein
MAVASTDRDAAAGTRRTRGRGEATTGPHILVVDDDDVARGALERLLRAEGFLISTAPDGEAALAEASRALPDVVLTDLEMPRIGGVELCKRLHEIDVDLPVIVMTALSDMESVLESLRVGAEDYLIKPLEYGAVLWCVKRALARRSAKREHEELYRTLNERLVLSSVREQEHAEAEAQHRAQLTALLENLSEGVTIADPSGRIVMMNGAARAILGVEDRSLLTVDALYSVEAHALDGRPLETEQRPLHRALRGERFKDYEVLLVRPNGERRHVVSTGTCVTDENGNVVMAIVMARDVTKLRTLEQQRDEYLGIISHDLRNPLNSILMCVSMLKQSLQEKRVTEQDLTLAERAERNVMRMTSMIEELTEATSLESKGGATHREACDMREIVTGAVDGMEDARGRRIIIETSDASSYVVLADAGQLERVVANLLTNALKYSADDALVTVRLACTGSDVELRVIDCGIGIAPESVRMLFDRYFRTTTGKARASGLGLGLYIARLIVEGHGGRIDVASEVGVGSTFTLTLPRYAVTSAHVLEAERAER